MTQFPNSLFDLLVLYGREGCCLCKGLEEKLQALPLEELTPPLMLHVMDIDGGDIHERDKAKYDLEVPVLFLLFKSTGEKVELPRISPRLDNDNLFLWLQKFLSQSLELH